MHYGGNSPAPLGEMGVAVSPKGTIYVAGGLALLCSSVPPVYGSVVATPERHTRMSARS